MAMIGQAEIESTGGPSRASGRRWSRRRIAASIVGGLLGALLLAVVAYSVSTAPKSIPGRPPLDAFNAEEVGHLEQEAWAAYYLHQWPTLFDRMLRMTRG